MQYPNFFFLIKNYFFDFLRWQNSHKTRAETLEIPGIFVEFNKGEGGPHSNPNILPIRSSKYKCNSSTEGNFRGKFPLTATGRLSKFTRQFFFFFTLWHSVKQSSEFLQIFHFFFPLGESINLFWHFFENSPRPFHNSLDILFLAKDFFFTD
jgi:hypothetical protein